MASIIIKADTTAAESALSTLQTKIKDLQTAASKVKIEIKADGIQTLDKQALKTINTLTKYANAQARLENATNRTKKSENDLAIQMEKTRQATEKTAQEQLKTERALNKTGDAIDKADKKMQGFISTFVKSAIIYQAIYSVRQVFLDALDTMKQVDSQLVTVRKVTQATASEINQLRDKAYATASKYGVGAADYLESVANFARAGYRDQSDALAELSTKTQIVGDTTAEVANQFLLSMDAAYQYQGSISKLTAVLDGANEIDNNYATSIEKIAEGLGLIAPIAAQVHMTEAELTAAIGTITATTQRSGSEAARALRALVLNIIGDTTTEIEDGVTATTESINSLRGVLKKYAPDVVAAADATGQIIDPMEAIGALSKAMKDGLLTEQQLMEQLSALGGKLRTSQLVALVSNFDMYESMLSTYSNAVGSADREVENALDSWERKAAILANTWTELIQGSINTDFIKGFIDGLTQVLKLFGNLGNMLMTVGGAFAALKLPAIIERFNALKTSITNTLEAVRNGTSVVSTMQVTMLAATAVLTAYTMAYNAHKQAVHEAAVAAKEEADAATEQAHAVYDAYAAYNSANEAYENGTGTKEQLVSATKELINTLGEEAKAAGYTKEQILQMTAAEIDSARQKAQIAKNAADYELADSMRQGSNTGIGAVDAIVNAFSPTSAAAMGANKAFQKDFAKTSDMMIAQYKKQQKVVEDYAKATRNGKQANEELTKAYEQAQAFLGQYGEQVENILAIEEQMSELDGMFDNLPDAMAEAAEGAEGLNDNLSETERQFSSLTAAATEAEAAIQKYKDATKTEKNDAYKGFAGMYEDFLTDWEAGLKSSNKVQAAIEGLLPEEVLNDLWRQGKDAGELLASEFYQGIFTYIDDNGQRQFTKGEDSGSLLAYALWDSDTLSQYVSDSQKVIKIGDEVVASLTMDGDKLSVSVTDFEKLSQALYQVSGVTLSADTLAAWLQALGMYGGDVQYTAEELNEMAKAVDAVNEAGQINLEEFVKGQLDLGKPKEEIRDIVDKIIELDGVAGSGISIDVSTGSVEEAKKKCAELIETAEDPIQITAEATKAENVINAVKAGAMQVAQLNPFITVNASDYATSKLDTVKNAANSIPRVIDITINTVHDAAINAVTAVKNAIFKKAVGTMGAAGGMTLVNELGPEVIQEGATARIAGGGQPTITWVEPGARIYNANDTKMLLAGNDPSLLFGGIAAFAGGTASGITRWRQTTANTAASSAGTAVASSAARGTSTGNISSSSLKSTSAVNASGAKNTSSKDEDAELKRLKDIVSLRESELALLEAQDATVKDRINKQKQIQSALMDEINRLRAIGGSQEDINKLYTQWYKVQKDIADLQDSLYNELKTAIKGQVDKLNEARDAEKKTIQEQLDAMEEQRNTRDEQLELEEKILAVQKAEAALQNAMTERTVRYYNAITGQWEWAANAGNVKSAAEQLESAQKALSDYQDDKAYQNARAALEAQMDAIDAKYDDLEERWDKIVDSLEAPVKSVAEALTILAKNYVPTMSEDVKKLNSLLAQFGYSVNTSSGKMTYRATNLPVFDSGGVLGGIGGIKATALNEMILPPDITSRMLSSSAGNAFASRMNELRYLYGVGGSLAGITNNKIGTQHNGNVYRFGNISLSDSQARTMTVADLARLSRGLSLYSSRM